ncbi:hypothetical protein [Lachnotalea glycerini]|jgi:hypothetical protein|uniref:Uncharacterized protein n=1 Tax=Lachnotalea glycerini TaxID=1763509 RepID=A0A371JCK1_9FIRM|nr:hypothetical protein [Lachnotalea glycerini]RDY30484.1 hypothetical protein CG710_014540 [Lachnotalea glycerini]
MNNPKLNNVYNESDKNNFVVMYNQFDITKEKKVRSKKLENESICKNSKEIIEYTDDVAEQVRALYDKIILNLEMYFQGEISMDDVNNELKQYYFTIKNYCIKTGVLDEKHDAYKSKILKDIYRNYRYNSVIVAANVNDAEGKNLAVKLFDDDLNDSNYFVYYNSNYYYECEKVRGALYDMVNRLALEENISDFDTESIDKRKRYVYDYGFNHAWLWNNKMNIENDVDINKNLVPPQNMQIFFKEKLTPQKDCKIVICCKDEHIELDIRLKEQDNYNLLEILQNNEHPIIQNEKLKDFLDSFYVSARIKNK